MLPAPSRLDYETWRDQIRKMGGRFDPKGDPKTFTGWVRPTSVSGLMAAEVGSNAHRVERTRRDVRVDGADHYVVLFQLAGRSAMTHNEEAVRFGAGDVVLVDVGRPATFFAGNAGESWNTMALVLPRQALVSHLGFEPRGGLHRRNRKVVGRLLLDLIRNARGHFLQRGAQVRHVHGTLIGAIRVTKEQKRDITLGPLLEVKGSTGGIRQDESRLRLRRRD